MFSARTEALRDTAARATLAAIRRDRAGAPSDLQPLLAYMGEHLFDAGFRVEDMMLACKVRGYSAAARFRTVLGEKPSAYFRERRLRVAEQLVLQTDLEVWMVAELLGYTSQQHFTKKFHQRFDQPPAAYRRARAAVDPPDAAAEERLTTGVLRQALDGKLDLDRARALIRRLERLYVEDEARKAEAAWEAIRDLRWEDQLYAVRERFAFRTQAFFDLLDEKSREAGRLNRQIGVELAMVALCSLAGSADHLGDQLQDLRALGFARLGNARRLALDYPGAEAAFEQSDVEWQNDEARRNPLIEAEICGLKAAFRTIQHRFDEALELAGWTIAMLTPEQSVPELAKALILRANIFAYKGDRHSAIEDLKQALPLHGGDRRLQLAVYHNLAGAYYYAERYEEAEERLWQAQGACAAYGEPLTRFQLSWLDGLIKIGLGELQAARSRLAAARSGFLELGESRHAGMVALDLAFLSAEEGRSDVLSLAAEALPILESFGIHREAVAARKLLQEGIGREQLPLGLLQEVRSHVDRLLRNPSFRLL